MPILRQRQVAALRSAAEVSDRPTPTAGGGLASRPDESSGGHAGRPDEGRP